MFNNILFFSVCLLTFTFQSCKSDEPINPNEDKNLKVVTPIFDSTSLVRNPAMGWTLYDDANDYVSNAAAYWQAQNGAARKYASIFYWRSRWSELEPEEGKYAWDNNENFKDLIQGALDRGLKLAFCVYIDGQDNIYNGTPDFVRTAGAKGYAVHRLWDANGTNNNWTPYVDDPVFQEKFSNFIKAFALKFDDPTKVDFVDGSNLGWWGENHHIQYLNANNKSNVFKWIFNLYGNSFKKVLLFTPFGSELGWDAEKLLAVDKQGYNIRRNGLGSQWFQSTEISTINTVFPKTAFMGESCYWGANSDTYKPWTSDAVYKNIFKTWVDVYKQTCTDALRAHANTLDLREIVETKGWTSRAEKYVTDFMINGGYRLLPKEIRFKDNSKSGDSLKIIHTWENKGVGVCPNNNIRWNYKYKVAFALLDTASFEIKQQFIDGKAEPSQWIKGFKKEYISNYKIDVPSGTYKLAVAIIDTSNNNLPGLNLAVKDGDLKNGWLILSTINITK